MKKSRLHVTATILTCVILIIAVFSLLYPRFQFLPAGSLKYEFASPLPESIRINWDTNDGFDSDLAMELVVEQVQIEHPIPRAPIEGLRLEAEPRGSPLILEKLTLHRKGLEPIELIKTRVAKTRFEFKIPGYEGYEFEPFFFSAYLLTSGLLTVVLISLTLWHLRRKESFFVWFRSRVLGFPNCWFWTFFIITLALFGSWLYFLWPACFSSDFYFIARKIISGTPNNNNAPWFVQLLFLGLWRMGGSPGFIGLVLVVASSALVALAFYQPLKYGGRLWVVIPLFLLGLTALPIHLMNLQYSRDPIHSIVLCWFALIMYTILVRAVYRSHQISSTTFLFAGIFCLFQWIIRVEGLLVFFLAIIYLIATRAARKRTIAFGAFIIVALFMLLHILIPIYMTKIAYRTDPGRYSLTPLINPVGAFFHHGYFTTTPEKDRRIVSALMPVDQLAENYSPEHIHGYFKHGPHRPEPADLEAFKKFYFRSVLENFPLFMANRTHTFFSMLGSQATHMIYDDSYRSHGKWNLDRLWWNIKHEYLWHVKHPKRMGDLSEMFYEFTVWSHESAKGLKSPRLYIWNALPLLLILLTAAALYKWFPCSALASLLVLIRLPIVFFFGPASHFKYIYSFYLFGLLVIPLCLAEWHIRRQTSTEKVSVDGKSTK